MGAQALGMAAGGLLGGLFSPSPQAPSFRMPKNPIPAHYQDALLRRAFDPQSELYQAAAQNQAAMINRELAKRGMANSGAGLAAQSQAMADLQSKMASGEVDRMTKAVQALSAPYAAQVSGAACAYQGAADIYGSNLRSANQMASGLGRIGGMAGKWAGNYDWGDLFDSSSVTDSYGPGSSTRVAMR